MKNRRNINRYNLRKNHIYTKSVQGLKDRHISQFAYLGKEEYDCCTKAILDAEPKKISTWDLVKSQKITIL